MTNIIFSQKNYWANKETNNKIKGIHNFDFFLSVINEYSCHKLFHHTCTPVLTSDDCATGSGSAGKGKTTFAKFLVKLITCNYRTSKHATNCTVKS